MKKFIWTVLMVLVFSVIILLGWAYISTPHLDRIDFSVSKEKHIAVLGPSTTGCAIDDSRVPGYVNISLDGANFDILNTYLPYFLGKNPQIDTVLISAGRFLMVSQRDEDVADETLYGQMWPGWYMKYRPFLEKMIINEPNVRKELLRNPDYYLSLIRPYNSFGFLRKGKNSIEGLGLGYINIKDHHILFTDEEFSIRSYDKARDSRKEKAFYSTDEFAENYQKLVTKLQEVREICLKYRTVPVFIYTPLYQFDRWVKWDGLYEYLDQCDSTILIADYEDFSFPDDSYYGDVHHLNEAGSQYFSDYLARNGLKVQTLGRWLEDHR